ncbi:uncharacterized protein LOC116260236 [Nymphaea colorata]|nr:uncharacterized protein LOC116260236 [Nymphaea colorata]
MMTKGKGEYRCYYSNKGSGGGAGTAAIKGRSSGVCVTKEEIAKYWRRKKMEEEEHLFSAVKAAARIKSRTLTEEEYQRFEESLESKLGEKGGEANGGSECSSKEIRLGIKDWWTRSWYAYLNQPAVQSADGARFTKSSYIVHNLRCFTPLPSPSTALGVF